MSDTDVFGQIGAAQDSARRNMDYWQQQKANTAAGDYVDTMGKDQHTADTGVPAPTAQPGGKVLGSEMLGSAAHHIEDFAHTLWNKFGLGDNNKPNGQSAVSSPDSVPSSPSQAAVASEPPPPAAATSPAGGTLPAGASSAAAPTASPDAAPPTAPPQQGAATAIPPDPNVATAAVKQQVAQTAAPGAAAAAAAAVPTAPQKAGAAIADQAAASAGLPAGQSEPPHSTTHLDYNDLDQKMYKAASAAARAGHDPQQVLSSLRQIQMGFIQSGMLRNLAAANQAIMTGQQDKLQQALKNVNYWLPDGKDLQTHVGPDGRMQYVDPINPKTPDGKPNWTDVTPQHIQLLADNVTDPSKFQETINGVRTAQAKIAHEQAQDVALNNNSVAAIRRANTDALLAAPRTKLMGSRANYYDKVGDAKIAQAAQTAANKDKVPFAVAAKVGVDASNAAGRILLGQQETIPLQIEDPKTHQMMDNPSLVAGKTSANNKVQPWWGKNSNGNRIGPGDVAGSQAVSANIAIANIGRMAPEEAATIGGKIYHLTHIRMQTHLGPDGKTPLANFRMSPDHTTGFLWDNGGWRSFRMHQEVGDSFANGENQSGDAEPTKDSIDDDTGYNPADYAPATEPGVPEPGAQ